MNAPRTRTGCPCLHPCDRADVHAALLQHGAPLRFRKGEVLWQAGDPADRLLGLCTGAVKLVDEWAGGRAPILDLVFRGAIAGEEAAVAGGVRTSTAVALSNGKAIALPADRLQLLLAEQPDLAQIVLRATLQRQRAFVRRLDELGQGPVEDRLARVLLRIGDRVGLRDARGTFLPVRLSRGDLAEMVGCRVETAIRVMTRWQRQGVVETQREGIVLKDLDRLGEAAVSAA